MAERPTGSSESGVDRRFAAACCLAGAAVALLTGCGSLGTASVPELTPGEPSRQIAGGQRKIPSTQALFQVRYEGDGSGSFKLVLRWVSAQEFRLDASDPLGRELWTLSMQDNQLLLLDHRAQGVCRFAADTVLERVTVVPLSVESVAWILLGELPFAPGSEDVPDNGAFDLHDDAGRRWTGRQHDGQPAVWTLWGEDQRPELWWNGERPRKMLSSRRGLQFRWRTVVRETLVEGFEPPIQPVGYQATECVEPVGPYVR